MKTTMFMLTGLILCVAATARAQYDVIIWQPQPSLYIGYATTAQEGYLRGMADCERADGQWLLNYSQAAVNLGEAQRRYLENRALRVKTYFELREYNRQARVAERHEVLHKQPPKPKKDRPATPLAASIGGDGKILWPAPLQAEPYAAECRKLETVVAGRIAGKEQRPADAQLLSSLCRALLAKLKERIGELEPQEYTDTVRFVKNLTGEAIAQLPQPQIAER